MSPKWIIIKLTGILFAIYAAYNVFIIVRHFNTLPIEGIIISAVVALLFCLLAAFAWTSEVKSIGFIIVRRTVFIIALLVIIALKLRLMGRVVAYFDSSKPDTVLYGGAVTLTVAAMLVMFVYFTFILKRLPLFPKACFLLPLISLILFAVSFVMEIILFVVFGIGLEASFLRTVVIRPVFYLSFIGLSAYFMFPRGQRKHDSDSWEDPDPSVEIWEEPQQ